MTRPAKRRGRVVHVIDRIDIHINGDGVPQLRAVPRQANPRRLNPHFRQGGLDGACGIYALTMLLLLHGRRVTAEMLGGILTKLLVKHVVDQIAEEPDDADIDEIIKHAPVDVLAASGTNAGLWGELVRQIAPTLHLEPLPLGAATASRLTEAGLDGMKQALDAGRPLLIELSWTKSSGGHAAIAVGHGTTGESPQPERLLLLDPASGPPSVCPWNAVLERNPGTKDLTFRWADIDRAPFSRPVIVDGVHAIARAPQVRKARGAAGRARP